MATRSRFNPFTYIADSGQERYAVGRVNLLLARIFSIGGLAVGLQMLLNALSQSDIISPWLFWPGFAAVAVCQLGLIYGAFFSGKNRFWQRCYALSIAFVIVTWFLGNPVQSLMGEKFYPWAWWGVGLAAVAAIAGFSPLASITFLVAIDLYWFGVRFFPAYGGAGLWLNLQDTLLTFLFAAVLGSLIFLTRYEASKVDDASARKIVAATEQARAEAKAREKTRLDALVHDKVLTTLVLAAKATTDEEQASVTSMAAAAITALNSSASSGSGDQINGSSFFAALEQIALAQQSDIEISRTEVDSVWVPEEVANALSEAMLQALVNSQQHAGASAIRELHLKGHRGGIKIVIKDNGRGFRMSRVPKSRLGLRISVIERVEMVGGRAFIDSQPGMGTNIVLEWGNHA
jgi:signal transduction histidine kinase